MLDAICTQDLLTWIGARQKITALRKSFICGNKRTLAWRMRKDRCRLHRVCAVVDRTDLERGAASDDAVGVNCVKPNGFTRERWSTPRTVRSFHTAGSHGSAVPANRVAKSGRERCDPSLNLAFFIDASTKARSGELTQSPTPSPTF